MSCSGRGPAPARIQWAGPTANQPTRTKLATNDLHVSHTSVSVCEILVQVCPSLLGSRGSAQGFLDVTFVDLEQMKKMRKMCCVFCAWRETLRKRDEMKRLFWAHNQVDLEPQMWYKE